MAADTLCAQAEETERRIAEHVERKCMSILHSEAVQQSLQERLNAERANMSREVDAELEAERIEAEKQKAEAQDAIQAKQRELHALESVQAQEVRRVLAAHVAQPATPLHA